MDQTPEERRRAFTWIEVARQFLTIVVAGATAYTGIRIDLQAITSELSAMRRDVSRNEVHIDKLRENQSGLLQQRQQCQR